MTPRVPPRDIEYEAAVASWKAARARDMERWRAQDPVGRSGRVPPRTVEQAAWALVVRLYEYERDGLSVPPETWVLEQALTRRVWDRESGGGR